ncbi:hypothetical protein IE81DRAFT_329388 [Ceraceosorus guamensis]|uniref:Uncharacterized protein n=1 Tax=Ceraceosorus guamensis TaxID=1522189 RepID=A0A316W1B6_9BASI|nr:hypothetical protein IE81DRAFT_329388 [Ceraceosorus guamensis]PWN43610.1 hypothetical protein IE81DRAFT_329388 [Ceraceosorus guamensis]
MVPPQGLLPRSTRDDSEPRRASAAAATNGICSSSSYSYSKPHMQPAAAGREEQPSKQASEQSNCTPAHPHIRAAHGRSRRQQLHGLHCTHARDALSSCCVCRALLLRRAAAPAARKVTNLSITRCTQPESFARKRAQGGVRVTLLHLMLVGLGEWKDGRSACAAAAAAAAAARDLSRDSKDDRARVFRLVISALEPRGNRECKGASGRVKCVVEVESNGAKRGREKGGLIAVKITEAQAAHGILGATLQTAPPPRVSTRAVHEDHHLIVASWNAAQIAATAAYPRHHIHLISTTAAAATRVEGAAQARFEQPLARHAAAAAAAGAAPIAPLLLVYQSIAFAVLCAVVDFDAYRRAACMYAALFRCMSEPMQQQSLQSSVRHPITTEALEIETELSR